MYVRDVKRCIAKLGASSNRDSSRDEQGRQMCTVDRDVENEKPTNQRQDEECVKEILTSIIPNNFYASS